MKLKILKFTNHVYKSFEHSTIYDLLTEKVKFKLDNSFCNHIEIYRR